MFRSVVTGLAVLLLAVAASAEAQTLASASVQTSMSAPPAGDPLDDVKLAEPESDTQPAIAPPPEAEPVLDKIQDHAHAVAEEVKSNADADTLYRRAMDTVRPAQATLDGAQRDVYGLLHDDQPEPEAEPGMAPQAQASVVDAWPQLAPPVLILAGTAAGLGVLLWLLGQSATVGAGAAGTAAARDGRRFLPFASPLFTRFEKDTVLGHPKREAIYGHIIHTPGITLQDLCQESGLSRTAVTHHLRLLEQQHLVVSKRVGRSRHFFENGGRYGRHQKDAYAVLHNDRSKDIHAFVRDNPGTIQKDLCEAFGIQASVAHWHMKRLLEADLVEAVRQGRTVSYFPSAPVAAGASMPAFA